jgi:hypothetical protein
MWPATGDGDDVIDVLERTAAHPAALAPVGHPLRQLLAREGDDECITKASAATCLLEAIVLAVSLTISLKPSRADLTMLHGALPRTAVAIASVLAPPHRLVVTPA